MEILKVDRKKPDTAIPQLEAAINTLLPVGTLLHARGKPPTIGKWKELSRTDGIIEYERVR